MAAALPADWVAEPNRVIWSGRITSLPPAGVGDATSGVSPLAARSYVVDPTARGAAAAAGDGAEEAAAADLIMAAASSIKS